MTTARLSRRTARTATAIGVVTLGLVALSGCEKPTPLATATVGTKTLSVKAVCWDEGKKLANSKLQGCLDHDGNTLKVAMGDKLRLGMESHLTEDGKGWMLFVNKQAALPDVVKKTYYSLSADQFFQPSQQGQRPPKSVSVQIVAIKDGTALGVWPLTLKRD
ncbi:DUF2771 domain-containing protein [Streptomyces sp. NPDC005438]|uniref:DUF2771 domain-containing protein n=1 Tax=Streptomyces sp. NPDC005438 TaxID=3156880 RepID=UPI0033B45D3F